MKSEENHIVVPWDFTEVAYIALEHAVKIAHQVAKSQITLLHIISGKVDSAKVKKKEDDFAQIRKGFGHVENVKLSTEILAGSIFSSISEFAESVNANLVVMGTHGIKGLQKLFGSYAYKVLLGSKVPFIIVKDSPRDDCEYTDIVLPIDFRFENMEKLESAAYFGRFFDSRIHIFRASANTKQQEKQINVNMNIATTLFAQNKIHYDIHAASKNNRFAKETINFAEKIKSDLILIMTSQHNIKEVILGEHEQNIIDNSAQIPVLCVNPSPELSKNF